MCPVVPMHRVVFCHHHPGGHKKIVTYAFFVFLENHKTFFKKKGVEGFQLDEQ